MPLKPPPNTPNSPANLPPLRHAFMLTFWAEGKVEAAIWRGCLEAPDGRRRYFQTLAELEQILGVWHIRIES